MKQLSILLLLLISKLQISPSDADATFFAEELSKGSLVELDRYVTEFFDERYPNLDLQNVTYDQQLLKSIKSIRHTIINNVFDYVYTSEDYVKRATGPHVDEQKCLKQMSTLVELARLNLDPNLRSKLPLSAINFLEANGRTEAGTLNGNFLWLGSYSSCNIGALIKREILEGSNLMKNDLLPVDEIQGRYCIAHLKANSWPDLDEHFGPRISLKVGVCVPQSCHTGSYLNSTQFREQVDFLGRSSLSPPFNGDSWRITYLYCDPDENSSLREWRLGTKLFWVAVASWFLLVVYANIKHQQKLVMLHKLRESVDIKMTISEIDTSAISTESETPENAEKSHKKAKMAPANQPSKKQAEVKDRRVTRDESDLLEVFSIRNNWNFLFQRSPSGKSDTSSKQQLDGSKLTTSNLKPPLPSDLINEDPDERCRVAIFYNRREGGIIQGRSSRQTNLSSGRHINIDIFDGVKVIATSYIIFSHTMMAFYGLIVDIRFWDGRMFDFVAIMIHNGLQIVGLFYIISGALLTYLTLIRYERRQLLRPTFWLLVIINRYLRLIPLYILVFWFAKDVGPFVSHGRGWLEYRTDELHPRSYCDQDSWMSVLTLTQELKVPKGCVPQAWYLSTDFRTLFVMPIFIIILVLNRRAGYAIMIATYISSFFLMIQSLRQAKIDYMVLLKWKPHTFSIATNRLIDSYVSLTIRISSYLSGAVVGHLLYLLKTGQIERWPNWFEKYALKLATITAAILFMGPVIIASDFVRQFLPQPEDINPDLIPLLIPFFKFFMEICLSIILLVLISGGGYRWLSDILSSRVAKVLSYISYGVFMTHIELMFKLPIVKYETSYAYLFMGASYFILTAHFLSFFLHLFYEMPINNILRKLVSVATKPKLRKN